MNIIKRLLESGLDAEEIDVIFAEYLKERFCLSDEEIDERFKDLLNEKEDK